MPNKLLIGAHLSTSAGLPSMLHTAVELGAGCAQIFTSNPQQWRGKNIPAAEVAAFKVAQAETGIAPVVSHAIYLLNLAALDAEILEKSRLAMREELLRCGTLGLPMVVMHLGAYKGGTLDMGLSRLAESLNLLLPLAEEQGVKIVLETTAGQGTYLGGDFAQFPRLLDMIPQQEKLGICLDLCHVFVAGYDLRDTAHYQAMWAEFDRYIGLDRLCVIHVNDTDRPLGSHGDRHAIVGEGVLGLELFRALMRDSRMANIPKILETPGGEAQHKISLRLLASLAT